MLAGCTYIQCGVGYIGYRIYIGMSDIGYWIHRTYGWTGQQPGSGFFDLAPSIGSETTFPSALCVIRCPSYLVWSRTFLFGVGLADLGDFGRYFGQNKEIVSVFYGPVVHFNAVTVLIFLARV
jgi:hypothetical protein